jgi:hypothetical protein
MRLDECSSLKFTGLDPGWPAAAQTLLDELAK